MDYKNIEGKIIVYDSIEEKLEKKEENKKKCVLIIFAIFLVIFACIGICFLLQAHFYDNITGYVLTNKYARDYCRRSQCLRQGIYSLHSAFLVLFSIIYFYTKKEVEPGRIDPKLLIYIAAIAITGISYTCICTSDFCSLDQHLLHAFWILLVALAVLMRSLDHFYPISIVTYVAAIVLLGSAFTGISAYKTYKVLTGEPTVEAVILTDKRSTHIRKGGTHYDLIFSNNSSCMVSRSEFYQANIGDEYYIAGFDYTFADLELTFVYKFDADTYSLPQ